MLNWFKSYLGDRTQTVLTEQGKSSPKPLRHGVPQGSVLGPTLFKIYVLPLLYLLKSLKLKHHCYADDTQIYIPCSKSNVHENIANVMSHYKIISNWLSQNFLKLNDSKTEVIIIGSPTLVNKVKVKIPRITLGDSNITISSEVRNLGVLFDETLSFEKHIRKVANNCIYHLRNLNHAKSYFTRKALEIVIHAYISTRLDYCDSLFSGLPKSTLRPLQMAQNFAARIIFNARKFDHVTPLLKELHWLPIEARIKYKVLITTYKCLNDLWWA